MNKDEIHKKLKKIMEETIFPADYQLPFMQPARLTPIPDDQHRDYKLFSNKRNVHSPIIELVCDDLLKAVLSEKETETTTLKKEKKKEVIDLQSGKEICYEEIVRESFQTVNSAIIHPCDSSIEVEAVFDIFPDKKKCYRQV